eukprot:6179187-Prymnesium_polylepis.1
MCDCNHRSIFPIEGITHYQPATDMIMVKLPPLFGRYPTAEKVQPVSAHYHRSCDLMSGQTHQDAPNYIVTQGIHQDNVGNKIRSSQDRATMAGMRFDHGVISSSNVIGSKRLFRNSETGSTTVRAPDDHELQLSKHETLLVVGVACPTPFRLEQID